MDPALITAGAALGGSLFGGLTTFVTAYLVNQRQGVRDRLSKDLDRREDVYAQFNQLASELFLDSFDRHLDEPGKLIGIWTLTGRIRLTGSANILAAAEFVIEKILESYRRPAMNAVEVVTTIPEQLVQPLIAFTEACRAERETVLRRLL